MKLTCRRWTPAAALTGLVACVALAADTPSDPLTKLRSEWRAQVAKDTEALRIRYAEGYLKLEREFAEKGDYQSAAKARRERKALQVPSGEPEKTAPTVPASPGDGQPVVLELSAASLTGGVSYDAASGTLRGWTTTGAAARWLLPSGLRTGGYEIELTWACAADSGGDLGIKEEFYSLRRTIKPTAGWDDWQTAVIGTIRLVTNSRSLDLSAATVKGGGLFQLKSVRLVPVTSRK